MNPCVMILGASKYMIRSIQIAKRMGCRVLVTDGNPRAEGLQYADYAEVIDITDIDQSICIAKHYQIDAVVPMNDFGVPTAAAVATAIGLVGISHEAAINSTCKSRMRKQWERYNLSSVKFNVVKTLEEAYQFVEEWNHFPMILKPDDSRGGGSRGVSRVETVDELPQAFEYAQSVYEDKSVIIEECLEGSEHSIETITYDGKVYILAVSDKVKTPPPSRVDHSVIYPSIYEGQDLEKIHETVKAAVTALEIDVGAAHVELCMTKEGPKLFEIGARCGGGHTPSVIIPYLTGIEMFEEVIRISLGEKPSNLSSYSMKGCVYRFVIPPPGIVKKIKGIEEIKKWKDILDCELWFNEGDTIPSVKTGHDRSGYLIAGGKLRQEAVEIADRAEVALGIEVFPHELYFH